MSDSTFSVNTDGMTNLANGYADGAKLVDGITNTLKNILDPERLANAAGNDHGGREFLNGMEPQIGPLRLGFEQWRNAVDGAEQQLLALRNGLDEVDNSTTNMAQSLHGNNGDNQSGNNNTGTHHH